jgi:hypothetical protein
MRKILVAAFLVAAAWIPANNAHALQNEELLALVAMPLAVAAVSEVTDVPMNDLIDVVTLMNDATVPPAQFIEVLRYAPAALVVETEQPRFAEFVRVQYNDGLRGTALVNTIEERLRAYGIDVVDLDVIAPRIIDIGEDFLPPSVVSRLAERRAHPHGGPPGQLKKELGLKTGADVVHGTDRRANRVAVGDDRGRGKGRGPKIAKHDDDRGGGKGKGKGPGKGKGKG